MHKLVHKLINGLVIQIPLPPEMKQDRRVDLPQEANSITLMPAVQVAVVKGKAKRFGAMTGRRSDWKKAYVSLAAGQTIDFLGGE